MEFSLVRPCKHCLFRTDIHPFLTPERVADILHAVLDDNMTFTCHETISGQTIYDENDEEIAYRPGKTDQHCVGALLLIEYTHAANAMVQIAERLGIYDPTRLDRTAPIFTTAHGMYDAHIKDCTKETHHGNSTGNTRPRR